jgi:hypothetical protein
MTPCSLVAWRWWKRFLRNNGKHLLNQVFSIFVAVSISDLRDSNVEEQNEWWCLEGNGSRLIEVCTGNCLLRFEKSTKISIRMCPCRVSNLSQILHNDIPKNSKPVAAGSRSCQLRLLCFHFQRFTYTAPAQNIRFVYYNRDKKEHSFK